MPADSPAADGKRTRVAVVFGGRSTEHSISCLSAGTVLAALTEAGYDVLAVGVTAEGAWVLPPSDQRYALKGQELPSVQAGEALTFSCDPAAPGLVGSDGRRVVVDAVFPVLHGRFGEDGTVQGLFEMAGLPYVGAGVYASAAAMDKAHMKAALRGAGLPIADYAVVHAADPLPEGLLDRLGAPVFVKPARGGSSIGISKVSRTDALPEAISLAAQSDSKVLIEAGVKGREVECAVLAGADGGRAEASVPAEVTVAEGFDFYDFDAKYLSDATTFTVPAQLPADVTAQIQRLAVDAYEALDCDGLARVDVFVCPDGRVVLNELNTMPGFTAVSMFPRMWAASGLPLPALVDRLVQDALRRRAAR
ncbi:MAG TPA: D-alanine--D-alanine ligase family protein [Frankiaceae bacterium]|jgi:D-alanine-D-alanine ligase|nr:D-alanine--D-alanine ligase family protein [Frankiaceae bacterium]